MDSASADRTFFGHAKGAAVRALLTDLEDVRDDLSRALDENGVADLQAEAIDFVHIVQGGTADSDASDLHGFEDGDGRKRAGATDLHANVVDDGGFLARGVLVGDSPARGLSGVA